MRLTGIVDAYDGCAVVGFVFLVGVVVEVVVVVVVVVVDGGDDEDDGEDDDEDDGGAGAGGNVDNITLSEPTASLNKVVSSSLSNRTLSVVTWTTSSTVTFDGMAADGNGICCVVCANFSSVVGFAVGCFDANVVP